MMWEKTGYPEEKEKMYAMLQKQLAALLDGERDPMPNMANMSALLGQALSRINWVGFYLMRSGSLLLGPFQGLPACIRIPVGRGVCGTAVAEKKLQLVADVHAFPGHIACDGASNSEIVVPLMKGGQVIGVLDIDSPDLNRFDPEDAKGLEVLAQMLTEGCDWA